MIWSLGRIANGQLIGPRMYNGDAITADLVNDVVAIASTVALIALVVYLARGRASLDIAPAVAVAGVVLAFNVCDATAGGVSPEALARHLLVIVPLYLVVAYIRRPELTMALLAGSVVLASIAQTLYFHHLWFT